MLALSPQLFPRVHGWALEDLITDHNLLATDCNEANSYNPLLDLHTYGQINHDFAPEYSISSGEAATTGGGTGDDTKVVKKLSHNASERDRRKRVNELYAFLGSLLPILSDQKKKLSIPRTVTRALKYIPELRKEVETLRCKKEKLLSYSTIAKDNRRIKKQSAEEDASIETKSSSVSSVNILGDKEVVIQLISSTNDHMSKNKKVNLLSKALEYLEQVEDELVLINATTFKCSGEGMVLSTLHFQVQGDYKIESEKLKEKLDSLHH